MQFSLRQLLMVFPAFLIAWGVGILSNPFIHINYHHQEFRLYKLLRYCKNAVEMAEITTRRKIPLTFYSGNKSLDQVLEENLQYVMPLDSKTKIPLDIWDRPLCLKYDVIDEAGNVQQYGLYSLGQDGISTSEGNDPDDLSSWSSKGLDYYANQRSHQRTIDALWHTLWLTPIIYGLMYGMWYLIWGKKADEPVVEETGHALDAD